MMTELYLIQRLCYYDPRNPDYDSDNVEGIEPMRPGCMCDNCFYGRSELADEILKLRKEIEK